ncbi:Regulator of G-protein signaling 21 [Bagarius yarrelli]|uniref:Regulator of G-protein signaling 21 n=1 Tax=Bagarius yarrelli TaxID=175774 RepID=A0A556V314_BAGYA|nr:Regulator of G-protein signaling 21 [Bagarius yarrelli]
MPSLPRTTKELDIMTKEERPPQSQRKDFKMRLKGKLIRSQSAETRLPGETLHWSQSLETLLKSKTGKATFQAFLKSEFSDENIEFWMICEDFKKIKHKYTLNSRAKKIFERYIQTEAPKEINIDHRTREVIKQNMQTPTRYCFDEAQKIVFGLMEKDSYPRFLRSDLYRACIKSLSY